MSKQVCFGMRNRLYREDCKTSLHKLLADGVRVDLIYLDPPFNSSRVYHIAFKGGGQHAQAKAFDDTWNFHIKKRQLALDLFRHTIESSEELSAAFKQFMLAWVAILEQGSTEDRKLLNYLVYMTERIILMKRVLAEHGSIYFHCDPYASHYIKIIMDGVFGRENFRNEIVWCYTGPSGAKRDFPRKHDVILRYTKSAKNWVFNPDCVRIPYKELHTDKGRHAAIWGKKGRLQDEAVRAAYLKRGKIPEDYWTDIPSGGHISKSEWLGYPTQKPLALLTRIIKASSNPGDVVLDPFCGCGTSIAAAIQLGRSWIGMEISTDAMNEIKARILQAGFTPDAYAYYEENPQSLYEYNSLNPFEKQGFLIRKIGGYPNHCKASQRGIDGEMTIHLGKDSAGKDTWGKLVFSVKSGRQAHPGMLKELKYAMQETPAAMGGLIVDKEPTPGMEREALNAGYITYIAGDGKRQACQYFDKVQILTSTEIMDGNLFKHPPSLPQEQRARRTAPPLSAQE